MPKDFSTSPTIPEEDYLKVPLTRASVLSDVPKWEDYFTSTVFITPEQQHIITRYEQERQTGMSFAASVERATEYLTVFFTLPHTIHSIPTLRYILLTINTLTESSEHYKPILINKIGKEGIDLMTKIICSVNDWFVRDEACLYVSRLCGENPKLLSGESRVSLYGWLALTLKSVKVSEKPADVRTALHCLMKLLFHRQNRLEFTENENFDLLTKIAKDCLAPNKFQFVYEAFYCIWLLSFEDVIKKRAQSEVITIVISALKILQKEKITRISLAILKNLSAFDENMNRMIECQALKFLPQLQARKTVDPEIEADLNFLLEVLEAQANAMSTWETYRHSVLGGALDWSPVHKSENFWKENPFRFEEHNNEVLIGLLTILKEQKDSSVSLSVACYDVGEFVLNHPKGKSIVTKLGIKRALMDHMISNDSSVKRNAVLAYQKIVLHGWEAASEL